MIRDTPRCYNTSSMQDSFHEVAFAGCSCKNNLPSDGFFEVQLAHPCQVHSPLLLLGSDDLGVALRVVDELPNTENRAHGLTGLLAG